MPKAAKPCGSGEILMLAVNPAVATHVFPGFSDTLFRALADPLRRLGYCLQPESASSPVDSVTAKETSVLFATIDSAAVSLSGEKNLNVILTVVPISDWNKGLRNAVARPLVTLPFTGKEIRPWTDLLVQKTVENFREQFMAHLLVHTRPPGGVIRSSAGLEGKAPVEWIVPMIPLTLSASLPGYLPERQDLQLAHPGFYNLELHLTKRRFYHSKWIYPAMALAGISAASYALENLYYDRYLALGAADQQNRPQVFAQRFGAARNYERVAAASSGLSLLCFSLSFWF